MKEQEPLVGIINDEEDLIILMEYSLKDAGFKTATARLLDLQQDSSKYPAFLKQFNPAILIFDVSPPYRDNWLFIKSLLSRPESYGLGAVLTSTNTQLLQACVGNEEVEIIGKPFETLDSLPQAVLRSWQTLKGSFRQKMQE